MVPPNTRAVLVGRRYSPSLAWEGEVGGGAPWGGGQEVQCVIEGWLFEYAKIHLGSVCV